ncbi:hypothetical protein [Variovorax sp. PCZ-1]|uniref:hypothetical protein n=1 Tax=Variovorax sp. PCZ-1 TaxID=2835533 RepID=UPI001BCE94E1|nr:hypothetical protein [Variovorax sp. PCZ-1]MBS7807083.1 hypothetical protein [Variovorax sp. PCZ-1]
MNIHQLSVNYIQEHDRILVRINTTAGEELRLWFTRRLTLGLMPMVEKIVAEWVAKQEAVNSPAISPTAAADAQTQAMLAEFKREESLQKSDFQTPYKAPNALPLGPEPLLVTELSVTPLPSGQLQLSFNEKLPLDNGEPHPNPRGFRVALEQKLVHGFVHLLQKAVETSQWAGVSVTNEPEPALPGEGNMGGGERPKYLN